MSTVPDHTVSLAFVPSATLGHPREETLPENVIGNVNPNGGRQKCPRNHLPALHVVLEFKFASL